jgi:hypothetical protein
VSIGQDDSAFGNLRLYPIGGGKLSSGESRLPAPLQCSGNLFVEHHPPTEDAGDGWLGEVVAGWSEAAGSNHGAGSLERLAYRGGYPVRFVANRGATYYCYAGFGERARDVRGVGVDREAEEGSSPIAISSTCEPVKWRRPRSSGEGRDLESKVRKTEAIMAIVPTVPLK